ncbi:helix-turn-helix domain-containing protein [Sporomusa termitida]|uniref:LexA repressor n=1 Tax=Sporomusa termitida TaxID=2377 RepID=A0A517DPE1_9FIRM|nr:XRE family transcriptional regulator [Sporomusa termitida]QDR79232.1 LexA repressor [Sporomusa termitida]
MSLGSKLRGARLAKGLSQIEVKRITGINNKTLSNYENSVSSPDPGTLKSLAELYEVTTDYLLDRNIATQEISTYREQYKKAPILASIPCGRTLAEQQDKLGEMLLPPGIPAGEYYYLFASGDSMEPTIYAGDMVLVHITTTIINGKVYAVRVDNETTLKRVFRYNDRVELVPDNPKHPRQIYSSKQLFVNGQLIKIMRDIK